MRVAAYTFFFFLVVVIIITVCNMGLNHSGSCTNRDISISQSIGSSSGIPQYIVQIVNTCVHSGCAPSNIHIHCGWFASARIVNPRTFKRVAYDDCLVNGGRPLRTSQTIRFTYSNSFMYPLAFKVEDVWSFCEGSLVHSNKVSEEAGLVDGEKTIKESKKLWTKEDCLSYEDAP
ncbi:hypothetical protein RJ640_014690 [Escallonia rubra]|uniref:Uncharacterized protein n=1 Tax=Escallonia rubra TaxID=112253 RepID=A0AA88UR37_9ASTE|nr:hypothetical protein RJ640_014690 [Escallonia rubra]